MVTFAASYGLAAAAAKLAPSGHAGSLAYAVSATLGALPAFSSIAFTTWYGPVAFIASILAAFLVYGIAGAILTRNPSHPVASGFPMAIAGLVAASLAFVLVCWLPVGGSFSVQDYPTGDGFYLPVMSLAFLMASGLPAGYVVARFEYASGIGFPWTLHAVGGFGGVVAGSLYFAAMVLNIPSSENSVVTVVRIVGFAAPSVGAFLAAVYIHLLVMYHRDGYPGLPLRWAPWIE